MPEDRAHPCSDTHLIRAPPLDSQPDRDPSFEHVQGKDKIPPFPTKDSARIGRPCVLTPLLAQIDPTGQPHPVPKGQGPQKEAQDRK